MAPFTRATRISNQARAVWKFCLSFRKRSWELSDYPVFLRTQDSGPSSSDFRFKPPRFKLPRFVASITNWHLSGTGDSEAEALKNLQMNFASAAARREAEGLPFPRPGARVPIGLASQVRVEAHRELAEDFIHRILELDSAWISDESSLWDFHADETNDAYFVKIKETYGADVFDIESARLFEVLERIAATQTATDRTHSI